MAREVGKTEMVEDIMLFGCTGGKKSPIGSSLSGWEGEEETGMRAGDHLTMAIEG